MYTIFSYNVNGIRAALRKGLADWMASEQPDILCIQETKAQPEQIDCEAIKALGYLCYNYSAQKKGYSGVAIFSKHEPRQVHYGMGKQPHDDEGRVIRADFNDFTLINAYFPSGTTGTVRQDVKMQFLADIYDYTEHVRQEQPHIILTGDFNICHKPIDINNPQRHKKTSGFLPEERQWMDEFLAQGFVDSFRVFNQEPEQYSWWTYRSNARARNKGWRIDYHMVSTPLHERLQHADIHQQVMHSDHCPVSITLK